MKKERAIKFYLMTYDRNNTGLTIFSSFIAGLRDARKFTDRDPDSGKKLGTKQCGDYGSWLGAIGYLTLLDQIGSCFKPKTAIEIKSGSSIQKTLKYFTDLSTDEIDAVYALRCAFAHDYSLYNVNPKKQSLTHQFEVLQSPVVPLIKLPDEKWDGNYEHKTQTNKTIINLEALGDLVELVCDKLFTQGNNDGLEVILPGGSDELLQRYSLMLRH